MPYYPEKRPIYSREEQKQQKGTEKRKKFLRFCVVVVFCLAIGYGGFRLIRYQSELDASRNTSRELRQIHVEEEREEEVSQSPVRTIEEETPAPTDAIAMETADRILLPIQYPDNPDLTISERFRKLRKKGKYIVGWISFDEVDEAVVKKDNTFFLTHDAKGKKNSNGAIFLDSEISLQTRPYTLILYGHNMKSGSMFGRLKKYKKTSYFYQHRIITFDSMYEDGEYAVFAVMEMNTEPGTALWYDLWSLTTDSYLKREEAIRTLERRSVISNILDVQADDQLLLLVTCLDGDTERLVVAARRLRDGEKEGSLTIRKSQ